MRAEAPDPEALLAHLRAAGALSWDAVCARWGDAVGPSWMALRDGGQAVESRGLLWDPKHFSKGARPHHAALLGETYLALFPYLTAWERERPDGGPLPDARLMLTGQNAWIWLEADTGKETHAQWLHKLAAYRLWAPPGLLVVAQGGPRRLQRLTDWVVPLTPIVPTLVVPADHLPGPALEWAAPVPSVEPPAKPVPPPTMAYYYHNHPIDAEQAEAGLASRRFRRGSLEIRHRRQIQHLLDG